MTLSNRAEMIPLQLFYIDSILLLFGLPFVIFLKPVLTSVIAFSFIFAYSFGAYDPFLRRIPKFTIRRIVLTVLGLASLCVCIVLTLDSNDSVSFAVTAAIIVIISVLHSVLRHELIEGSQYIVLSFHPDFESCAYAIRRHIMKIGYPARVTFSKKIVADPCQLPVTIQNTKITFPDDPKEVALTFDPIRFCDVALRVLPPETLDLRPNYLASVAKERTG